MTHAALQTPPIQKMPSRNVIATANTIGHYALTDTRQLQFDFLRATEMAALNCLPWIGQGDKESADAAACDAIRGIFDLMDMRGEIVIGEGMRFA
jgi:hypothetical protein